MIDTVVVGQPMQLDNSTMAQFTLRSQCSKYARHFHPNGDGTVTVFQEVYSPLAAPGPNGRHFIVSKNTLPIERARELWQEVKGYGWE